MKHQLSVELILTRDLNLNDGTFSSNAGHFRFEMLFQRIVRQVTSSLKGYCVPSAIIHVASCLNCYMNALIELAMGFSEKFVLE